MNADEGGNGSVHVIIGENGSGKTTALDALAVAMGIWHVACRGHGNIRIEDAEIREQVNGTNGHVSFVPVGEVTIAATGRIGGKKSGWARSRQGLEKNTVNDLVEGTAYGLEHARALVKGAHALAPDSILPVLAYYGAGRLWLEPNAPKTTRKDTTPPKVSRDTLKRFAPYKGCLDSRCRARDLNEWLLTNDWEAYQTGKEDSGYTLVKQAILKCLPGATQMRFAAARKEVTVAFEGKGEQSFSNLSDGQRNVLALVGDIAVKAVRLNYGQLGEDVLAKTPGIVLIDEVDLHLHPNWQRVVLEALRTTFPEIQFIATTHSPFVVQTLREGELVPLEGQSIPEVGNQGVEAIARGLMGVDRPEVSPRYAKMKAVAKTFLETLEEAPVAPEEKLKQYLDRLSQGIDEFADNPAYQAFLEMKREGKLGIKLKNGNH